MTDEDRAKLTPEQRDMLKQIDDLTAALSKAMDGQRRDVCLGALLNNIGVQLTALCEAGDAQMLMRAAVGCDNAAEMAADMVKSLTPKTVQ